MKDDRQYIISTINKLFSDKNIYFDISDDDIDMVIKSIKPSLSMDFIDIVLYSNGDKKITIKEIISNLDMRRFRKYIVPPKKYNKVVGVYIDPEAKRALDNDISDKNISWSQHINYIVKKYYNLK